VTGNHAVKMTVMENG